MQYGPAVVFDEVTFRTAKPRRYRAAQRKQARIKTAHGRGYVMGVATQGRGPAIVTMYVEVGLAVIPQKGGRK